MLVKNKIILIGSWYGGRIDSYIMPSEMLIEIDTPLEMLLTDLTLRSNN